MNEFAVIIPHYNDVDRLVRCLEALMPQVTSDMEVIVADNASSQSLEPVTARWPGVRLVHQPEKGAGPARNAGVAATDAAWILFLDADCVPALDWVATARRIRTPGVVFGGPVALFDETSAPKSGAEAFETVFAFQVQRYLAQEGFLVTAQMVLSRTDFLSVGGFEADVAEDNAWSRQATAAGLELKLCDELRVSHPTRSDWAALIKKWDRMTREMYRMRGAGVGGTLRYLGKAMLMPVSIVVHAPRVLTHSDLSAKEKLRALGMLVRLRLLRMVWMVRQVLRGQA